MGLVGAVSIPVLLLKVNKAKGRVQGLLNMWTKPWETFNAKIFEFAPTVYGRAPDGLGLSP